MITGTPTHMYVMKFMQITTDVLFNRPLMEIDGILMPVIVAVALLAATALGANFWNGIIRPKIQSWDAEVDEDDMGDVIDPYDQTWVN